MLNGAEYLTYIFTQNPIGKDRLNIKINVDEKNDYEIATVLFHNPNFIEDSLENPLEAVDFRMAASTRHMLFTGGEVCVYPPAFHRRV
jgi:hypothetical protein